MYLLSVCISEQHPRQHVSVFFMRNLLFLHDRSLLVASAEASVVFRQQVARARGVAIYARHNGRVHASEEF